MALVWTLALLIPVLYVNQEMVLRLGAVTGVGHAKLIFERFGRFWGWFSVGDLFILNALTIATESSVSPWRCRFSGCRATSVCRWRRCCCSRWSRAARFAGGNDSCSR